MKGYYGPNYFKALPFIDIRIYFARLRYCKYQKFVRKMNQLLGQLHSAIKIAVTGSDGALQVYFSNPDNHNGRMIVHLHDIYTSRCYQNGEQYRDIYQEMFPDEAINSVNNPDADAAVQTLRKLDLKRLGVNIERHASEYTMDATVIHSYRGVITEDTPVPMSWIALDLNTTTGEKRLDIREAEELLIESFFRHITSDMVTNTNILMFVRANFEIYNRDFEQKHAENPRWKKHSFNADKYEYPGGLNTITMTYISHTSSRKAVIDPRVREVKRSFNENMGYILFFDKNGRMGRKPFTERGYSFGGDALSFIEDVVQTGLIWRKDFKPETTKDFEENDD